MTRRLLLTALLGTVLAGCSVHHHHFPTKPCAPCTGEAPGDPLNPKVSINNGEISVDQEVIRFRKDQVNVIVTWRVPAGYSFPANGVVFERAAAQEIVDCRRGRSPQEFTCRNVHSRPGVYRYGINVNEGETPLKPLDPFVMND